MNIKNKLTKYCCRISFVFYFILCQQAFAQNTIEKQLIKVDSCLQNQNFEQALLHSYYQLSIDTSKVNISKIWNKIAEIKQLKGDYLGENTALQNAIFYSNNDSLKTVFNLKLVFNNLISNKIEQAQIIIEADSLKYLQHNFSTQYYFLKGVTYYILNDFRSATKSFKQCLNTEIQQKTIDSLFSTMKYQNPKNDKLYKNLSYFLPGSGQITAGFYKSGINSFMLNGLFIYSFINVTLNYNIICSLLTVQPWFIRYYRGGPVHIKHDILTRRKKEKDKILLIILDIYKKNMSFAKTH